MRFGFLTPRALRFACLDTCTHYDSLLMELLLDELIDTNRLVLNLLQARSLSSLGGLVSPAPARSCASACKLDHRFPSVPEDLTYIDIWSGLGQ